MLNSITTHRFNMKATILKQGEHVPDDIDPLAYGEFVDKQDPLTGEIVRIWVPYPEPVEPPPPGTSPPNFRDINCIARGIVDGGIRVAGTTEWFGQDYKNIDFIKMWVPPSVILTKRDRITNIRNREGQILWVDEEFDDNDPLTPPRATVFNVNGVTPLYDAFNKKVEFFVLLERADNLGEGAV